MTKSRPAVANSLRLLCLPPSIAQMVTAGTITAGHARAILALPTESLQEKAAAKIVALNLSVRQAETMCKNMAKEKPQKEEKKPPGGGLHRRVREEPLQGAGPRREDHPGQKKGQVRAGIFTATTTCKGFTRHCKGWGCRAACPHAAAAGTCDSRKPFHNALRQHLSVMAQSAMPAPLKGSPWILHSLKLPLRGGGRPTA